MSNQGENTKAPKSDSGSPAKVAKGQGSPKSEAKSTKMPYYVQVYQPFMNQATSDWDPLAQANVSLPRRALSRVTHDLQEICKEPPPGMVIVAESNDISRIHALITGPFDTPYEGGFFHFFLQITQDYPLKPPKCRIMTTGGGMSHN